MASGDGSHTTSPFRAASVSGARTDSAGVGGGDEQPASQPDVEVPGTRLEDELAVLDVRLAQLRADPAVAAMVAAALDPETEDTAIPALLAAGFEAWARELGVGADQPFAQDPPPGKNPRLHASLRLVLDPRTERHRRWAFRAIAAVE